MTAGNYDSPQQGDAPRAVIREVLKALSPRSG
jgi:hypothetical protein